MSSTTPWKLTNGPSMTRTLSPRANTDLGFGFSAPASICRRRSSTWSFGSATGFDPDPTNPVTLGVERTRCHVSSVSSISTSTYPGKNFCSVSRFCLLRTSTTFSVGTRTRVIFSPMPKILARDWIASATLFSKPEYVWTTNHCLFVAVASPLISDSFPSAAENPLDRARQHDVDRAQEERQHHGDHDDHHRGVDQLLSARPGDLAELRQDIQHELPDPRDRLHPRLPSFPRRQWQGWRDSNPHPPDLESGALAVRATPLCPLGGGFAPFRNLPHLLRFLMGGVLPAPLAVLLQFHAIRVRPTVLGRRVVTALTGAEGHRDDVAHGLLRALHHDTGAHRAAALADGEPQLLLHRDRHDHLDRHRHVVPRHHHLRPRRQRAHPRHVRRPEVELRPVPVEIRRVPPALFLRQHVHLGLELLVRLDRARLGQHLPPLDLFLVDPPQQRPDIVPRLPLVQQLAEHLHARHHRLARVLDPHDLHFLAHLPDPPPHPPPHPPPPPPP